MNAAYRLSGLGYRYGSRTALDGVTLDFCESEMTAVVGPNGAGKSTLVTILAGVRERYLGSCQCYGRELSNWNKRQLARLVAYIPQRLTVEFPFTAEQVVLMGRTPHCRGLFETEEDRQAVAEALELTDATAFAGRRFRELSGGEQQRVVLASALAQKPRMLLLDEPTTFLDLKHQIAVYDRLLQLSRQGVGIVAVTHDLNLAAAFADRIVAVTRGAVAADGAPADVLQAELLRQVFEAEVEVHASPAGRPWLTYGQANGGRA